MTFEAILSQVVDRHASVIGVVFCDEDGEKVTMVSRDDGRFPVADLEMIAAYLSTCVRDVCNHSGTDAETVRLSITTSKFCVVIHGLPGRYFLMALADKNALVGHVAHSLLLAAGATLQEM